MRRLSYAIIGIIGILLIFFSLFSLGRKISFNQPQPPHGKDFKISCEVCHSANGWKIDKEIYSFKHDSTDFPLIGQHTKLDCKQCHPTLVFSEAKNQCFQCHADIHESTVGKDCGQCHTPHSWLVKNISQIHQQSRFPLVGVHAQVDCNQCHKSETFFKFDVIGTECYNCHSDKYLATTKPNHQQFGFSTDCTECHNIFSNEWSNTGFNHNFFPLTQGHALNDCGLCHKSGFQTPLSPECFSCHQADYNATNNPVHSALGFSTNCTECHTTLPGWKPAQYKQHDSQSFPIYTGKHNGQWASCTDCHSNTSNYKEINCLNCHAHNKNEMDGKHNGESGYSYNSVACLNCHPMSVVND